MIDTLGQTEVEEEKANLVVSEDFARLRDKVLSVMEIEDIPGDNLVTLSMQHGEETIQIDFNCADDDDENEDCDVEDDLPRVNFNVEVVRDNKMLRFGCLAGDGLTISTVSMDKNVDENNVEVNDDAYGGPYFDDLSEEIQWGFREYLNQRHVNDDLALFIAEYSEVKLQKEYVGFLEQAAEFIDN